MSSKAKTPGHAYPASDGSKILITPISVAVHRRRDNAIFGENSLRVSVEDEAAGTFIILASNGCSEKGEVRIDMDELEAVVVAARGLISGFPNIGVRVAGHGVPSRAGSASDLQK